MKHLILFLFLSASCCTKEKHACQPLDYQEWEVYQAQTTQPSDAAHFTHVYMHEVKTDTVIRFTSNHLYIGTRTPGLLEAVCSGTHMVEKNKMRVNWHYPFFYTEDFQLFDASGFWVMRSKWREWMIKKP